MARTKAGALPSYCHHKASGRAIVRIGGNDYYLGKYGSPESKVEYMRLLAEWTVSGVAPKKSSTEVAPLTVAEVMLQYRKHCEQYYVKNGEPTSEQASIRNVLRDVRRLYGKTPAAQFGPIALKAVRQGWVDRGHVRSSVNRNVQRVTRMFRWAAENELIPPDVHLALASIAGLRAGRTKAREAEPVQPVEIPVVERTIKHLSRTVADMVRLQLLTGMRPGEVCRLRPCDLDRSRDVWEYVPESHKTEHHGRQRIVFVGPMAQKILEPYMRGDTDDFCFSPEQVVEELRRQKHAARTTPLSCGNRPGTNRKRRPKRRAGSCYDVNGYRRAIHRACDRAFPAPEGLSGDALTLWLQSHRWSPNRLRHTKATEIRSKFGLEAAQVILGHASADITQVYAERDAEKGREVARQVG